MAYQIVGGAYRTVYKQAGKGAFRSSFGSNMLTSQAWAAPAGFAPLHLSALMGRVALNTDIVCSGGDAFDWSYGSVSPPGSRKALVRVKINAKFLLGRAGSSVGGAGPRAVITIQPWAESTDEGRQTGPRSADIILPLDAQVPVTAQHDFMVTPARKGIDFGFTIQVKEFVENSTADAIFVSTSPVSADIFAVSDPDLLPTGATEGKPGTWTPAGRLVPNAWELDRGLVPNTGQPRWTVGGSYVVDAGNRHLWWDGSKFQLGNVFTENLHGITLAIFEFDPQWDGTSSPPGNWHKVKDLIVANNAPGATHPSLAPDAGVKDFPLTMIGMIMGIQYTDTVASRLSLVTPDGETVPATIKAFNILNRVKATFVVNQPRGSSFMLAVDGTPVIPGEWIPWTGGLFAVRSGTAKPVTEVNVVRGGKLVKASEVHVVKGGQLRRVL